MNRKETIVVSEWVKKTEERVRRTQDLCQALISIAVGQKANTLICKIVISY